jgi:hypothetical protein
MIVRFRCLEFRRTKKKHKKKISAAQTRIHTHTQKGNALNGMIIEIIKKRENDKKKKFSDVFT